MALARILVGLCLLFGSQLSLAATSALCPDAHVLGSGLFTNTCWNGMFPIKIAGTTAINAGGGKAPSKAAQGGVICECGGDLAQGKMPSIGFPVGFWEPTKIVEVVARPYCMPALGGYVMSSLGATEGGAQAIGGGAGTPNPTDTNSSVMHFHYYAFPLMQMLAILNFPTCIVDNYTSFDVAMLSETLPTWYDTSLAAVISPEAMLFANPVSLAAGGVDCAVATATGEPIDNLFWVAGCWGGMYPLSGVTSANDDPVAFTNLVSTRAMFEVSRLGLMRRTMGDDVIKGKCTFPQMPVLVKSQFKWQMIYPMPEASSTSISAPADPTAAGLGMPSSPDGEVDPLQVTGQSQCTHPIGSSTFRWGQWRNVPGPGENHLYLLWQWVDCCVGALGG